MVEVVVLGLFRQVWDTALGWGRAGNTDDDVLGGVKLRSKGPG